MELTLIFAIAILIMSVVIHEISHGYVAEFLGDKTARMAGRLTLNPTKHLDPVGSFLVPVAAYMLSGFIIGWARPVPYNPYNLSNQRWGEALVAAAGAIANLFIAIVFGLLIRFAEPLGLASEAFFQISQLIVFINIILAVFNLIPIPPLDGSKVLFAALPFRFHWIKQWMEQYWLILIILLLLFFWQFIIPIVLFLFNAITGVGMPAI